jgi:hypothetical protein
LEFRSGVDGARRQSLRQIGMRLGISGERVRQLETQALSKLDVGDGVSGSEWVVAAKRMTALEASLSQDGL